MTGMGVSSWTGPVTGLGVPPPNQGKDIGLEAGKGTWDQRLVSPLLGDRHAPVITVPFRRITYVGGNQEQTSLQLLLPTYVVRGKVIFILGNVCLFTIAGGYPDHRSGGTPSQVWWQGGYSIPGLAGGGTPSQVWQSGTPSQVWGGTWGTPLTRAGWGTPQTWDGVPLGRGNSPNLGLGTPPPSIAST